MRWAQPLWFKLLYAAVFLSSAIYRILDRRSPVGVVFGVGFCLFGLGMAFEGYRQWPRDRDQR